MKRINFLGLLVLVSLMSVLSCKKDESTPVNALSTADKEKGMLTAVSWVMVSRIESGVPVVIPDCEKDDFYTFSKDGTFSHSIGAEICGDETNSSGTWNLSLDLHFTFSGTPTSMIIADDKLVLLLGTFDVETDTYNTEMYFVPK